jgi:hypothetical protein
MRVGDSTVLVYDTAIECTDPALILWRRVFMSVLCALVLGVCGLVWWQHMFTRHDDEERIQLIGSDADICEFRETAAAGAVMCFSESLSLENPVV